MANLSEYAPNVVSPLNFFWCIHNNNNKNNKKTNKILKCQLFGVSYIDLLLPNSLLLSMELIVVLLEVLLAILA